MKRFLYYIYDRVADNFVYFTEAPADAVAIRSFTYACENDFKSVANDLELYCLGNLVDGHIEPMHVLVLKKEASHVS